MLIHASCVEFEGKGVLITGAAGAGKSDLALRLIDHGAFLVADDQTVLRLEGNRLMASAPVSIAGLIEIRHMGLMKMPYAAEAEVALYVALSPADEKLERLPGEEVFHLLDRPVRHARLPAFAASTPAKIRAALLYSMVFDHS